MRLPLIILSLFLCFISSSYSGTMWTPPSGGKAKTVYTDYDYSRKKWTDVGSDEADSFRAIIKLLVQTPLGSYLWEEAKDKAEAEGKSIYKVLSVGKASFTDTSLIRRFSLDHPLKMEIHVQSRVTINGDMSTLNAVLDLAHELTHFIYRRPFNPYGGGFDLEGFIKNTVEAQGGEVEAYLNECRVLYQLYPPKSKTALPEDGTPLENSHCHRIIDPVTKEFSKPLAIREFYKVGSYLDEFRHSLAENGLEKRFPHLNGEETVFISSAYNLPYPLAALAEFKSVTIKACANDEARLKLMKENLQELTVSQPGRADLATKELAVRALEKSYFGRCERIKLN